MAIRAKDQSRFWRLDTSLGEVQMLSAHYVRQHFARHTHDGYGVGVIEHGAMAFDYMGERLVAPQGHVNLVVPGEPHDGHAAEEQGWVYRMFYLEADTLRDIASQMAGRPHDLPFFKSGVLDDPALAAGLRGLHRRLESGITPLEAESELLITLAHWIRRHSDDPPQNRPPAQDHPAVARVRDLIETGHACTLSLDGLSREACLSPYHLLRLFRRTTGLPPHLYLNQVRVRRARELIDAGAPLAQTAVQVGYSDQSHLNRQFKRIFGITPGQYRKIVQE